MERLRKATRFSADLRIIVSIGNVAFIAQRVILLLGQFNSGSRGILNKTHRRLFTYSSLTDLLSQAGFDVLEKHGVPAPFPLVLGKGGFL